MSRGRSWHVTYVVGIDQGGCNVTSFVVVANDGSVTLYLHAFINTQGYIDRSGILIHVQYIR